jgi:hypothetical protein
MSLLGMMRHYFPNWRWQLRKDREMQKEMEREEKNDFGEDLPEEDEEV